MYACIQMKPPEWLNSTNIILDTSYNATADETILHRVAGEQVVRNTL